MLIVSLAKNEIGHGKEQIFVLIVTYFNYSAGEGVVVPMTFDTPEDRDESFELMAKIAKLQGGDEYNPDDDSPSMFSAN